MVERPAGVVTATVRNPGGELEAIESEAETLTPAAPTTRPVATSGVSRTPLRKNSIFAVPPRAEPTRVNGTFVASGAAEKGVAERTAGTCNATLTEMFVDRV